LDAQWPADAEEAFAFLVAEHGFEVVERDPHFRFGVS
jgi:hypothetical protein